PQRPQARPIRELGRRQQVPVLVRPALVRIVPQEVEAVPAARSRRSPGPFRVGRRFQADVRGRGRGVPHGGGRGRGVPYGGGWSRGVLYGGGRSWGGRSL